MSRISTITVSLLLGLSMLLPSTVVLAHSGTNHAPDIDNPGNFTIDSNETFTRTISVDDQDNDNVSVSMVSGPVNSSWNASSRQFRFTPSSNQEGNDYDITIRAVDQHGKSSQMTFEVSVDDDGNNDNDDNDNDDNNNSSSNRAPIIENPGNETIDQDDSITVEIDAHDPDGDDFTLSGVTGAINSSFNAAEREWTFRPSSNQEGRYTFTTRAVDEHGKSSQMTFSITVEDDNDNDNDNDEDLDWPSFGTQRLEVGETFTRFFTVEDDDDDIDYDSNDLPSGATYTDEGRFRWTPRSNQEGNWDITFRAELDGDRSSRTVRFIVEDDNGNNNDEDAPRFTTSPSTIGFVGQLYRYDANAFDPDGDRLNYRLIRGPVGAFMDEATGVLAWVPTNGQRGNNSFAISVYDFETNPVYQDFTVFVSGGTIISPPPVVNPPVVTERLRTFNIEFTTDTNNNVIVSWDNNKLTRGEVVYGFDSQPDSSRGLYNYTFTTGQMPELSTSHEVNLGQLEIGTTYYVRLISRAAGETDITSEMIVIPVENTEGGVIVDNDGTASAFDSFGDFLTSAWFLLILLLIILALLIYLLTRRDREPVRQTFELHS